MTSPKDLLLSAIPVPGLLLGISSPLVFAQESPPQIENAPADGAVTETETFPDAPPIEEITVQGRKTSYSLRMEIESVEEEVWGMFNEINSNDEFDVNYNREVYQKSVAMQAEMTRLAQENQAFFDALQKLTILAGGLAEKKAERFSFFK